MIEFPSGESKSVATRDFIPSERMDAHGRSAGVFINSKGYDEPVTEIVKLDSVEKWRFINTTDDAHPMHLHLVLFQIIERRGFNPVAFRNAALELVGASRPPAVNETGRKDTTIVNARECSRSSFDSKAARAAMFFIATCWNMKITT